MNVNREHRATSELSVGEIREQFAEILNRVKYGNSRTVVKRHGKEIAAVVSIDDLRLLERLEEILDRQAIKEADAEMDAHGTISWDDALRELGVDKDELRDRTEPGRRKKPERSRAKAKD